MDEHSPVDAVLHRLQDIGQGVWEVRRYTPQALRSCIIEGREPLDTQVIMRMLLKLAMGEIEPVPQCLLCRTRFTRHVQPQDVCVVRPSIDAIMAAGVDDLVIVANGICGPCANRGEVMQRVRTALQRTVFRDMRILTNPHDAVGHA